MHTFHNWICVHTAQGGITMEEEKEPTPYKKEPLPAPQPTGNRPEERKHADDNIEYAIENPSSRR